MEEDCSLCKREEATIRQRTPHKILKERAEKSGLHLVTTKEQYEENFPQKNKYIIVKCKCGNCFEIEPVNVRKITKCRKCADKLTGDRCRTPFEKVKEYFGNYSYTLISTDYVNESITLTTFCPKGHEYLVTFADFKKSGSRCTTCSRTGSSLMEQELLRAVKEFFSEAKKKRWYKIFIPTKIFIKRFELDIFNKATMRGVEFDGSYWHSFKAMRNGNSKNNWPDEDLHNYDILKDSYFPQLSKHSSLTY